MPNVTLGVFCPSLTCATSFYRAAGPLGSLRRTYQTDTLNIIPMNATNWALLKMLDYAFMQRPYNADHLLAARMIKTQGIPLWIDYDDYLFGIPEDNPCYKQYSPPEIQENIAQLLSLADVVTVSTAHLGQLYADYNPTVVVIRNALDDMLLPLRGMADDVPRNKLILWRGSKTHAGDLETLKDAAVKLTETRPDWTWLFLGCDPWFTHLMPKKNTIIIEQTTDTVDYYRMIADIRPALMVVPLVDSDFNRAKSDCSFLEGTLAGAAVIAPTFQAEFSQRCLKYPPGPLPSDSNAGILAVLSEAMQVGLPALLARNREAWQDVLEHRLLSQANITRGKVLDHLKGLRQC